MNDAPTYKIHMCYNFVFGVVSHEQFLNFFFFFFLRPWRRKSHSKKRVTHLTYLG